MSERLTNSELVDIVQGEVRSMEQLIKRNSSGREPRPDHWIAQHMRILQSRRQCLEMVMWFAERDAARERGAA